MPNPASPSFVVARRVVFGIALASYVLSFFHRTAPAALAGELTRAFEIGGAMLGTVAATYFYVYTVLQVPVGVLADTLGPRRILAAGSLIAGIGSLSFGLAPAWEVAALGRTLVGVVRRARNGVDAVGPRRLVARSRPAGADGVRARARHGGRSADPMDACGEDRGRQSGDMAMLPVERGHRRQLSRVRRALGRAVP
jgi:predicted MFS family arabinose efflux permease